MNELEEKSERLVRMLVENGFDAVILNSQHNFAWLTAGGSNGVDQSRENGVASLMVTREGKRFLFANSIEMPRMLAEQLSEKEFRPVEFSWQAEKANPAIAIDRARAIIGDDSKIATDIPISAGTPAIEGKVAACRYRLTLDEQDRFRKLGRDSSEAMDRAIERLEQGETERSIAERLRSELALGGMASVVTLVAADERIAQFRHPVPTDRRFDKCALLVTCAKRDGLIASLSRMVSIGEPSDELKLRTEAAAYVNATLLHSTRSGATGAELYKIAAAAYAERDFADEINKHHQGGAAGYKTRDWVAHPASTEAVEQFQAFAWNPSITGTKVEETVIVTETGIEVVTASPNVPKITTTLNGLEYNSPGILCI